MVIPILVWAGCSSSSGSTSDGDEEADIAQVDGLPQDSGADELTIEDSVVDSDLDEDSHQTSEDADLIQGDADGSDGEDPDVRVEIPACDGDAPIYIWVYSHHYLGGGGIYPRADDIRDAAALVDSLEIPATLFFDGILVNEIMREDDSLFRELRSQDGLTFGYHGEETHGPYPAPCNLNQPHLSRTTELSWDEAFDDTYSYATSLLDYRFLDADAAVRDIDRNWGGTLQSDSEGGVSLVEAALGDISMATFHGIESPPAQLAHRAVASVPVMQGTYPLAAHALPRDMDASIPFALGGEHDLLWHTGVLTAKQWEDSELPHGNVRELIQSLEEMDRSRPRFAQYAIIAEPGDFSPVERDLRYLIEEFLPENPNSRFITPLDLLTLSTSPETGSISQARLLELAGELVSNADSDGLPDYLSAGGIYYSLSDAFSALGDGLAAYNSDGELPESVRPTELLGPIGDPRDLPAERSGDVTIADVLAAAGRLAGTYAETSPARPSHVPYSTALASSDVHSGQMLLLMARTLLALEGGNLPDDTVGFDSVPIRQEYASILDDLTPLNDGDRTLWYAQLQLWTVKPLPFTACQ